MTHPAGLALLIFAGSYVAIGLAVGVVFLLGPIERATPGARGAYAFRPLLLPGLALLWPLVLWRWPRGG